MEALWVLCMIACVLWLLPIGLCVNLGRSRDRTGWAWGLLLGWLGVLILACMRPVPYDQRTPTPTWTADTMYPPPPGR